MTTDPSDIVERLLDVADLDARAGEPLGKACREAAAEIERLRAALEKARAEERERCAKVAETHFDLRHSTLARIHGHSIAAAIRARGR